MFSGFMYESFFISKINIINQTLWGKIGGYPEAAANTSLYWILFKSTRSRFYSIRLLYRSYDIFARSTMPCRRYESYL